MAVFSASVELEVNATFAALGHPNSSAITCRVSYIPGDADLAFFPILAPCQLTILGKPHPGEAELVNARHSIACRVSDSSWSIVYVILPPGDLPGPGDSGSALVQDERVVGLLHTCRGTAVSAEMIEREIGK